MGRIGAVALPLLGIILLNILGHCEMSIYPGLRRKPLQQSLQQSFDVPSDFLAQLMEENARRRLQQQFEQQLELIKIQMDRQRERQERDRERERYREQQMQELNDNDEYGISNNNNDINNNMYDQYDNTNVDFSYKYPNMVLDEDTPRGRYMFAVGPTDPRFYETDTGTGDTENTGNDSSLDSQALDEYEEYQPSESTKPTGKTRQQAEGISWELSTSNKDKDIKPVLAPALPIDSKLLDASTPTTFHRIKPQSAAAAAVAGVNVVAIKPAQNPASTTSIRHDITALIDKLQKEGNSGAIINADQATLDQDEHVVVRQHLVPNSESNIIIIALIFVVCLGVAVAFFWLGLAFHTFHSKSKAAADVEYPAYGVTGPNKDISPSGDRKLAQSAQMYHYQHQKQQIIAMENRQAAEGSCGLSDVESDDDNEEGDYTVYECPGLAPTGEMEVKNPLFLDETPLTPAASNSAPTNTITLATAQQPQTIKKTNGKAATSKVTSSSEEKKPKKK